MVHLSTTKTTKILPPEKYLLYGITRRQMHEASLKQKCGPALQLLPANESYNLDIGIVPRVLLFVYFIDSL